MSELDEIRKRKLEELQQRAAGQQQDEAQMQQELVQLELAVKSRMTKEAMQRYGNIKLADQERSIQLLVVLGQLLQSARIQMIDDNTLKQVLLQLQQKKKDFTITRK
ncbi:MAG: DNA-binding protein [Candidatus Woesearchaeota archaeon]